MISFGDAIATASLKSGRIVLKVLLDFSNAFARLSYDWMFLHLECTEMPSRTRATLRSMIPRMVTTMETSGAAAIVIPLASGLRQACPMSVSL